MTSEAGILSLIRVEAGRRNVPLWRNNSGAFIDKAGRLVRTGLGNESAALNRVMKSSDLIGIGPDGRLLAVEVKRSDWTKIESEHDQAQENFLAIVRKHGGIGEFCTSVEQFLEILECHRNVL